MEAPMVYPTAPFDPQAQQRNVDVPSAHAGVGENLESPGKGKAVLSKVKHKARKLKDKIKKATGSNTAGEVHDKSRDVNATPSPDGEDFDEEAESYEDEGNDDDYPKPNKNQLKYEQLRSIGALDSEGDGSEVEVHGGVPVSALADNPGTYWKEADDVSPISPYKSPGPPDTLQATPTEYRNYAADSDPLLVEGKAIPSVPYGLVQDNAIDLGKKNNPQGSPSLREVETANLPYQDSEPHVKHDISNTAPTSNFAASQLDVSPDRKLGTGPPPEKYRFSGKDNASEMALPEYEPELKMGNHSYYEPAELNSKCGILDTASYPEQLVKPSPSAGKSVNDKVAITDEDLSADRKLGVGLPSQEYGDHGEGNQLDTLAPEFEPERKISDFSSHDSVEPHSKYGISDTASATGANVSYPEALVKPHPSFGKASSPTHDKIAVMNEDQLDTLAPDFEPERKIADFPCHDSVEPHSKYGVSDTASAPGADVSYPEDLVKPNPSFGKSSSPTHDKIAVMNEDMSPDRKLGGGLSSEEYSGSGKGNLLDTSVPEFEELRGYRGRPSVPPEADELVYKPISDPEEASYLTSPPGTLDGVLYEPNAGELGPGTAQYLDNSQFEKSDKSLDLPRSGVDRVPSKGEHDTFSTDASLYGEQNRNFDIAPEQPADGGIATAGDGEHESWGKWSADKINGAKEVTVSDLIGTGHIDEIGTPRNSPNMRGNDFYNAVDVAGSSHEEANSPDDGMTKLRGPEDEIENVEEEYYDPNDVNDSKFQEGFTYGSGEEDVLSGTLAGSAIDKLQGLKETMQSSLGYSNHDDSGAGVEQSGFEREVSALSPSSHQQQKGGFVQGLKASLGYGKASSDDDVLNNDVSEEGTSEDRSEPDAENRQQQSGGSYQVLKNAFASKLGYGKGESSPVTAKESESEEYPAEPTHLEPSYDEDTENADDIKAGPVSSYARDDDEKKIGEDMKAGPVSSDGRDDVDRGGEVSRQQQSGGVLQGAKDMVTSKLGYNNQAEEHPHADTTHDELPADHQPSSYTQKFINTTAAARDFLSSKVGYGKSHEEKGEGNFNDGQKFEDPSAHVDNKSDNKNV